MTLEPYKINYTRAIKKNQSNGILGSSGWILREKKRIFLHILVAINLYPTAFAAATKKPTTAKAQKN